MHQRGHYFTLSLAAGLLLLAAWLLPLSAQAARAHRNTSEDLAGWNNLGLYGDVVNALAFSATPGRIFLAANHGAYTSSDNGATWTRYSTGGGQSVAISPLDGRIYTTGSTSADGGATWQSFTGITEQSWMVAIDSRDSLAAYISTGNDYGRPPMGRIYRTQDGGQTWTPTLVDPDICFKSLAINPASPDELWVASGGCVTPSPYAIVYRSTDRGLSFQPVISTTSPTAYQRLAIGADGTVYLGGDGVWVKPPGQDAFTKTGDLGGHSLLIHPTTGEVHIPGYCSRDHGQTWQPTGLPPLAAIDPHDPQIMFSRDGHMLLRTTDGGQTWAPANTGLLGVLITSVEADPHDERIIYATSQNGLARSRDNGQTWDFPILINGHPTNNWAVAVNPFTSTTLLLGDTGAVLRSADGGDTWERHIIAPGATGEVQGDFEYDPLTPGTLYIGLTTFIHPTPTGDGVYESHDDGRTWELVGAAGKNVRVVRAVAEGGGTTVYAGIGDEWNASVTGGLYRRRAGESAFTALGPADAITLDIAVDPRDPRHVYLGLATLHDAHPGGILESHDGGDSWTQVYTTSGSCWSVAIDPQFPDAVYASTGDAIVRSLDGGATWSEYAHSPDAIWFPDVYLPWLAPAPLSAFNGRVEPAGHVLEWHNPTGAAYAGTLIRYSTSACPQHYNEGELLADLPSAPGATGSFTHTGVLSGTHYYYAAFTYDSAAHYSAPLTLTLPLSRTRGLARAAGAPAEVRPGAYKSWLYAGASSGLYRRAAGVSRLFIPLVITGP